MFQLQQKLKVLKVGIKKWNLEDFGNNIQSKMEMIQQMG